MVVPTSGKREQVLKMIEAKEKIESQINQLGEVLKRNNIGMTDPLVDAQGFPRNDIDVYQVRHARHEIRYLQNDLKDLMREIEAGLADYHAEGMSFPSSKNPPGISSNCPEEATVSASTASPRNPFLVVNLVVADSPADEAGLQVRDEILEFGTINHENFKDLQQIGELVRHSQDRTVNIKVKRGANSFNVSLTPKTWSGRGLLGCNVVPIQQL